MPAKQHVILPAVKPSRVGTLDVIGNAYEYLIKNFAASGGHVTHDIPAALAEAGFEGRVLPPLGLDPRVVALVAAAVQAGQPVCAAECRYRKA